jgi:hypothetical protein
MWFDMMVDAIWERLRVHVISIVGRGTYLVG